MTEHQWNSESIYLPSVTGQEITASQRELNNRPNCFVKATQIFPVGERITGPQDIKIQLYDAFIYYSTKKPEYS